VRIARGLALGAAATFLLLFLLWPVATILGRGLWVDGHPDLAAIGDTLRRPGIPRIIAFTFAQAAISTVVTVALGLPGAYVLSRYRFRGRAILAAALTIPFVLPTVVVGTAFLALLGPGGPLADLGLVGTLPAILLAHACLNYAVVVRTVGTRWAHLDHRAADAARTLGASRWRTWWRVTLPALRPAVVASTVIVFLFSFTSFGVILILGGPGTATIETEIHRVTVQSLDLRTAAVLSIIQMAAVGGAVIAGAALAREGGAAPRWRPRDLDALPVTGARRLVLAAVLVVMAGLVGAPLAVLVQRSIATGTGPGLAWYRALGSIGGTGLAETPTQALVNSLAFAVVATVIAVAVGGAIAIGVVARRGPNRAARLLDRTALLPLGLSAVTIGFGYLITLDTPPFDLRTSWWIIPIAQALVAIPFVVRTTVPMLRSVDPRLRDAAATLGATPARVWRAVDLPALRAALATAAAFAFAVSLGEFGATVFIVRPETTTLPVAIYRMLGRPGAANRGTAWAASVVLMVVTTLAVLAVDRSATRVRRTR
jgi:thiamine transport system permease protein